MARQKMLKPLKQYLREMKAVSPDTRAADVLTMLRRAKGVKITMLSRSGV